ncbi:class I SAM-dependent methyltransferase [Fredinandcohnia humi]
MIERLRDVIVNAKNNEITYEQYMDIVLYDPIQGYYMKEGEKVGTKGDFITSSNISTIFGKLFATLFHKLINEQQITPIICEIGGGNGRFAKAVLNELALKHKETYEKIKYIIIETSPYHLRLQQELLPVCEKVVQYRSLDEAKKEFPSFNGIIFSNELFDAFPVRVIEKRDNSIHEVKIAMNKESQLYETFSPLVDEEILEYLTKYKISLVNGQRFEVPLAMNRYLEKIEGFLGKGTIFTVDYGYTNEEWCQSIHRDGSLRGYINHQLIKNPLLHPGDMDLTTHIHFDTLITYGSELGLEFVKIMRQDKFLVSAGILQFLEENYDPNPFSEQSKQNRAIRSLIIDGSMSSAFHVVIQQKDTFINWGHVLGG